MGPDGWDAPVTVQFVLGRQPVPHHELEALRPGRLFALDGVGDGPLPVLLEAGGQRLAAGELVTVGGRVFVRVVADGPRTGVQGDADGT